MAPTPATPDVIGSITAATNTNPIVITPSLSHGLNDGDEVKIDEVEGNLGANGAFYVKVIGQDKTSFELYSDEKLTQPVAGTGNYQSGGTICLPLKDDYAIVVGINNYRTFTCLRGPESDALQFQKWLVSPRGGMMAMKRARIILSRNYPPPDPNNPRTWQPALDDLKQEFRYLSDQAFERDKNFGSARLGRRLYIFLSGHGITPAKAASPNLDDAALLMANASPTTYGEHLTGYAWAEWFRNAAAFDEIVLLMDCCRDQKDNIIPGPCTITPLDKGGHDSVAYFYATGAELDAKSWEKDFGPPPDWHGVFSYALMQVLQNEALRDSTGKLTGDAVTKYLYDQVPKLHSGQNPKIIPKAGSGIDFVTGLPDSKPNMPGRTDLKPNLRVTFDPAYVGQQALLFVGASDVPFSTHVVNGGVWSLPVERKIMKLSLPGGQTKYFELDLSKEVTDVKFP